MSDFQFSTVAEYIDKSNEELFDWSSYKAQEIGRVKLDKGKGECCIKLTVGGTSIPFFSDEKMALLIEDESGAVSEYRSWFTFKQGESAYFEDVPNAGGSLVVLYTDSQAVSSTKTQTKLEAEKDQEIDSLKQSIFSTRTSDNITSVAKSVAVVVAVGALVALAAYAAPYAKALLPGVKK